MLSVTVSIYHGRGFLRPLLTFLYIYFGADVGKPEVNSCDLKQEMVCKSV